MGDERQPVPCQSCEKLRTEGVWIRDTVHDGMVLFCFSCWGSKVDVLPFKRSLRSSTQKLERERLKARKVTPTVPGGWNRKRRRADPQGYAKALKEANLHPEQLERDGL